MRLDLLLPVPPHPVRRDPAGVDAGRPASDRCVVAWSRPSAASGPTAPAAPSPSRTSRSTRTSSAASARSDAARTRRKGPCRTRCYTPGRAEEPRDRRVAGQGADDRALPRRRLPGPRLLRPRPRPAREPGQGQVRRRRRPRLRPRVRRSPTTAASRSPRSRRPPAGADMVYLATDLDREGEAIAWHVAEAAHVPAAKTRRVTFSEITEPAIREAFAHPRDIDQNLVDAQQTRRIVDRLVGYTLSPLLVAQGPRRPVGRPRPVGRGPPRRRARARDRRRSPPASTGRSRRSSRPRPARRSPPSSSGSTARRSTSPTRRPPTRHAEALARARTRSSRKVGTRTQKRSPGAAVHDLHAPAGGEPQARLQPEADDVGRAAPVRGRRDAATARSGSSPTCGPTRPRSPASRWARRARSSASATATPYTMPKGRVYKTKSKGAQEAHESIRPTSFRRDPDSLAGHAQVRRAPPVPADLAARPRVADGGQGARDDDRSSSPTGRTSCARRRRKVLFDGFARVYTEGRDDDAADDEDESGRLPALAEGDVTTRRRRHADPALHRAAAALHRGDADQGARGARHRPAVDVRRDDLDDRRPRLRPRRGAAAAPGAGRARSSPTCSSSTSATTSTSSSRPGWRRSSTRSPAASARGCRCCARSTARCATASTRSAASSSARDFTTEATDEVCSRGPPDGHPARPERPVPRLLAVPGAQGEPAAARATSRRPRRATGEVCPKCGEGTLVGKRGRFGPFVGCSRYPDCDYIKKDGPPPPDPLPFEVICPKNNDGHLVAASRAAHRERLLGVLEVPEVRLHDERRAARRPPRRGRRPARPARARRRSAWSAARRSRRRRTRSCPGERYAGGPPNPEALARPARARRGGAGGSGSGRGGGRARGGARAPGRTSGATVATRRTGRRRVSGVAVDPATRPGPRAVPPDPRRARRLAAHPALVRDRRRRLPRLARRRAGSTGGRPAGRTCAPTSPTLGDGPRALVGRPAAGRDPLVPPLGRARRPGARRSVGRDRDAAPAAPPAARPRGRRRSSALLAVVDGGPRRRGPGRPTRAAVALATALALRDRALVETAYAAGPADQRAGRRRPRLRSTCDAARSGSSGKGRKERIGLLGRPARAALAAYLDDGRPVLLGLRGRRRPRRRPRSS